MGQRKGNLSRWEVQLEMERSKGNVDTSDVEREEM